MEARSRRIQTATPCVSRPWAPKGQSSVLGDIDVCRDEKSAQSRTWQCLKTIDRFLSDLRFSRKKSDIANFDIRQNHTWGEVLAQVDAAVTGNEAKADGWTGLFRKGLRKVGESSTDGFIDPLLGLLPQDYYSCLISGGIKLVFGVRRSSPVLVQDSGTLMRGRRRRKLGVQSGRPLSTNCPAYQRLLLRPTSFASYTPKIRGCVSS